MTPAPPSSLWLVGCGNMAGAMLRRWVEAGTIDPAAVFVVDRSDVTLPEGVRQGRAFPAGPLPDAVMLGVKPQQLDSVLPFFADRRGGGTRPLILSILAGVTTDTLAQRIPGHRIVRVMPNLPVALGKGVVALHGPHDDAAEALMQPLGLVEWIADEALFDVVTALSGSGPGFTYRFIDALAAAGTALGLPADQAQRMALATVEGSGLLAAQSDASPAELADRVASPGGSTRAGLDVLDANGALIELVTRTLDAATRRNAEMAAEARNAPRA